ncbi:hypothetical protein [Alteromonas sp. S005]
MQSILEQYDADSLTSDNATSIVEQLKSEGKPQRPLPDTATFEVTA